MRIILSSLLALFAALVSTNSFAKGKEYNCTVVSVINFYDDANFIAKNMKKRFLITLDSERVYVTSLSNDFEDSQKIYTIVRRDNYMNDVYAVSLSTISIDSIVISENYFEGSYNATLMTQNSIGVTAWKLDCQAR